MCHGDSDRDLNGLNGVQGQQPEFLVEVRDLNDKIHAGPVDEFVKAAALTCWLGLSEGIEIP